MSLSSRSGVFAFLLGCIVTALVGVVLVYRDHESANQLPVLVPVAIPPAHESSTIMPSDVLQIEAVVDGLNVRRSVVEPDGNVALGARWGRVNVGGKTLLEAEEVIRAHIAKNLQNPEVLVVYAGRSMDGAVPGVGGASGVGKAIEQIQRDLTDLKAMVRELADRKP